MHQAKERHTVALAPPDSSFVRDGHNRVSSKPRLRNGPEDLLW